MPVLVDGPLYCGPTDCDGVSASTFCPVTYNKLLDFVCVEAEVVLLIPLKKGTDLHSIW